MGSAMVVLVAATTLGSATMGGAFYAFSSFVMPALGRLDRQDGAAAMQSINVTALWPGFMLGFFGTAALSVIVAAAAVIDWDGATSPWLLAGAASYAGPVFGLTAAFHVPRNNRLARVTPGTVEGDEVWAQYLVEWTQGNHVRAVGGIAGAAMLITALCAG